MHSKTPYIFSILSNPLKKKGTKKFANFPHMLYNRFVVNNQQLMKIGRASCRERVCLYV